MSRPAAVRPALPWVIAGIVMVALSLRAPIIAPTAVIADIREGTGLSAAGAGLLTGLPVLLFALATPLASRVIRRFGPETTIVLCLAGIMAGTLIRSSGPALVVLGGTAVIGAAMTLGNIAVPVLIRRDVPWNKVSSATAAYSATMNVGSMATLLGTAPLAGVAGWRWAIAAWSIVTAVGLIYWVLRRRNAPGAPVSSGMASKTTGPAAAPARTPEQRAHTQRIVALLVFAFCGQSAAYYATTAWLPLLLTETRDLAPAASGASASLFQVAAILGAFGVPLLANRTRLSVAAIVVAVFWITLPVGLLIAPQAFVLWSIIGGIAQGGGFTVIFSVIPRISHSDAEAASVSARIQGGGYLAATAAPPLVGWLNTLTGGWTAPLVLVLVATLTYTTGAVTAARLSDRD
ncbi:MAG: MFS transporter [Arthrobacter sp.]